jgi:ribonuclease-3
MAQRGQDRALERLQALAGHRFARPDLLEQALTHPSAASAARSDNQRLEFLGDRVLGLVIAEALLEAYPAEAEGDLAPRLNALVQGGTLAEVAAGIGLGEALRLGRSESLGGGRRKKAILADAMEAVIAALYLDGGPDVARRFVLGLWRARIDAPDTAPVDAKSLLQQWAQARGQTPPDYAVIGREGPDHAPRFTVEARLQGGETARGVAASKRQAEQAAASAMLAQLGIPEDGDGRN